MPKGKYLCGEKIMIGDGSVDLTLHPCVVTIVYRRCLQYFFQNHEPNVYVSTHTDITVKDDLFYSQCKFDSPTRLLLQLERVSNMKNNEQYFFSLKNQS